MSNMSRTARLFHQYLSLDLIETPWDQPGYSHTPSCPHSVAVIFSP